MTPKMTGPSSSKLIIVRVAIVHYSDNSGASVVYFWWGWYVYWAVEHNVTAFSELCFAVRWQGRLSRGWCYE